jgi:hypothetical protein
MNAQPLPHLSFDRSSRYRAEDAMASAAHAVDSSEPQAAEPALSWKQRSFVVMLFLIALAVSLAAVCSMDPPAAVPDNPTPHAAARVTGSSQP